jgi:hypothetical protein
MATGSKHWGLAPVTALMVAVVGLRAAAAWGQGSDQERIRLIEDAKPGVVKISLGDSLGSGFVVDADKGLIATNYHVIEGAKQVSMRFGGDCTRREYPADGFVAIMPGKDLALIHVAAGERKLRALKLCEKLPAQGETVYTIGSPIGMDFTVSNGMVSAVRSGQEVSDLVGQFAGADHYRKHMQYDIDATWIQISAPISPGNSGGPLLNTHGEVLGLNTWNWGGTQGQNLNFSVHAAHLRQFIAGAGTNVHPWSELPAPRKKTPPPNVADPETTLAMWKAFNKSLHEFDRKLSEAEKKLAQVPPINPVNPLKGWNLRMRKLSAAYNLFGSAYNNFAAKVKGLDSKGADLELIGWTVAEGAILERTASSYRELAASLASQDPTTQDLAAGKVTMFKEALATLRTQYDILRVKLSNKYNKDFPTVDET